MALVINPNLEERKRIGKKILNNEKYCPCMIVKSQDTLCPCKDKREKGICICRLYVEESEVNKCIY